MIRIYTVRFRKTKDTELITRRMSERNIVDAAEELLIFTGTTFEHAAGIEWVDLPNGEHAPKRALTEEEYFPLAISILKNAHAEFEVCRTQHGKKRK